MTNSAFHGLDESERWAVMVGAAKRGAQDAGFELKRKPGRGMANVWELTKSSKTFVTSIRTTRDRWVAYVPQDGGTKWKTLDSVERVLVATVDDKANPTDVEVYMFDAADVRKAFDEAYTARVKARQVVREDFGMWICLDEIKGPSVNSAGSGLASRRKPIAVYPLASLVAELQAGAMPNGASEEVGEVVATREADMREDLPLTIADAKRRLALTLGVREENIKITIEA